MFFATQQNVQVLIKVQQGTPAAAKSALRSGIGSC